MTHTNNHRFCLYTARFLLLGLIVVLFDSQPLIAQTEVASATVSHAPASERDRLYAELAQQASFVDQHYGLLKRVVKVVQPSVVHIQANKTTRGGKSNSLVRIEEAGAGVIIQRNGKFFVVTNRHVIVDAETRNIRIQLNDGRFFSPTQVYEDPGSDIALLALAETDLSAARFGNSEQVSIGDFVVAVGSPFGLSHSVSYGIISAKGRRDLELGKGVPYQDFMQTDAAINPGNSGGPLMNLRGEVIGINTAIASNSGGNDGIGFTVPIDMVHRIVEDLIEYGSVRRGFMGVKLDSKFSPEKAQTLGLNSVFGARVTEVYDHSPASAAHMQSGDIIISFNGKRIENDSHLVSEVGQVEIGKKVSVVIYRGGYNNTIDITIQERKN